MFDTIKGKLQVFHLDASLGMVFNIEVLNNYMLIIQTKDSWKEEKFFVKVLRYVIEAKERILVAPAGQMFPLKDGPGFIGVHSRENSGVQTIQKYRFPSLSETGVDGLKEHLFPQRRNKEVKGSGDSEWTIVKKKKRCKDV